MASDEGGLSTSEPFTLIIGLVLIVRQERIDIYILVGL